MTPQPMTALRFQPAYDRDTLLNLNSRVSDPEPYPDPDPH